MRVLIAATSSLVTSSAFAPTQVANSSRSGHPARVDEVKVNLDALETAIDQRAADLEQLQDAVGGTWMGVWQRGVGYGRLDLVEYQG